MVVPTLTTGGEGQTLPNSRYSGLSSLKLRPIFLTLQIQWVLRGSPKVTQTVDRKAEVGNLGFLSKHLLNDSMNECEIELAWTPTSQPVSYSPWEWPANLNWSQKQGEKNGNCLTVQDS